MKDRYNDLDLGAAFPEGRSQADGTENGRHTKPETAQQCLVADSSGQSLKRFRLILRDGSTYSIPYSLLPIVHLKGGKTLSLSAHGLNIIITGRNLHKVEHWLNVEQVVTLRESPSGMDDGEADVFISKIEVECEYL